MPIMNELFGGFTELELQIVKKEWENQKEEGPLEGLPPQQMNIFINLLNNHKGMLDKIEKDPAELLGLLPLKHKNFKTVKLDEVAQTLNNLSQEIAEIRKFLSIELQNLSGSETQRKLYLFYYHVYLKALDVVRDKLLPKFKMLALHSDELKELDEYFESINVDTFSIKERYHFDPKKTWEDLPPSYYYFERGNIDSIISKLEKFPFIENCKEMIEILDERRKSILPLNNVALLRLRNAIDAYHEIEKGDPRLINKRIKMLVNIAELATRIFNHFPFSYSERKFLLELIHHAENKCLYLRNIMAVPRKVDERMFRTEHVEEKPLVVDKKDWLGDIDPAHRSKKSLKILYDEWQGKAKKQGDIPQFWIWMEGLDKSKTSEFAVDKRYTIPNAEKLVTIEGGILYNARCSTHKNKKVDDGIYLYNIDKHNNLYILPTPKDFKGVGTWGKAMEGEGVKDPNINFNHNSVLHGASIKCAGCVCVKNGQIIQLDTDSGHYMPQMKALRHAIKSSLLDKNVFHPDAIVTNFEGVSRIKVEDFMQEGFDMQKAFPKEKSKVSAEELIYLNQAIERNLLRAFQTSVKSDKAKLRKKLHGWAKSIHTKNRKK